MKNSSFYVTFWGVRGSRPVPEHFTLSYGGNTPCISIEINNKLIVIDAGTGICNLGKQLMERNKNISADIFISHYHWDHIQGFPFFSAAYAPKNTFRIYSPRKENISFKDVLEKQMISPFFPVSIKDMKAQLSFHEIKPNDTLQLEKEVLVKTIETHHPGGNLAYRIENNHKSCCYITDTEHSNEKKEALIKFIQATDMLIYDCHFTNEEYLGQNQQLGKEGWGHSTWQEGVKLAKAAKVKQLVLFHHSPERKDDELMEIEKKAQDKFIACIAAKEGMILSI